MIFLRYHAFGGQSFRRSRKMRTFWTQRSWLRKWRKTWRKSFQISMTSRWRRWRLDQKMPKNRKYGVWRGDHQGILSCLFLGRGGDHKGRWWALECFQVLMSEVLFVGLLSLFVARVWVWFLHDSRWVFRFMVRFHGDVSFMGFMACPPQNQCPIFILTFSVMQPATFWMYRRLSICSDCIVVGDTQLFQPAVRHFQRSCQTSSTPWRHLPRRPETAMRPHWWCRRRRWTRCGKFGEAFWESIQLRHHHSWFIIHYPSSSWTALHPIHFLPPTPLFFFSVSACLFKEAELRQQSLVAIMLSATPKIKPKPKKRVPPMHGEKRELRVSGREYVEKWLLIDLLCGRFWKIFHPG